MEGNSFPNSQANNNNITNIIVNSANSQTQSPNNTLAIAHLPPWEGSNSLPGAVHLPSEDDSSSQQTVFTPAREENNSSQTTSPPVSNPPQSSRSPQAGQGNTPPQGWQARQEASSQATTPTTFPEGLHNLPGGPTKVLQRKNLTLGGLLTYPTNP